MKLSKRGYLQFQESFTYIAIEDVVHTAQMVSVVQPIRKGTTMLYALAVILVVLWVLGMLTSFTLGGLIHLLLVIAIIAILFRVISGRSVA